MERLIWTQLKAWKSSPTRKPLILRGVRQSGKTWLLKKLGEELFPSSMYFNFEGNTALNQVFKADLNPERILSELQILQGKRINPKETLIIFDEIQFCNEALTSLKYFNEIMPELAIASAGSLLGLALSKPLSFPVGKVEFLDLYPFSFKEFLLAMGKDLLCEQLDAINLGERLPDSSLTLLRELLHDYYFVGGMPEVVQAWSLRKDIQEVDQIQHNILDSYELDFAKHAPDREFEKLSMVWHSVPVQLARENQKFLFSHAKEGARAKDLESALQWLVSAGLVFKVPKLEKPGIPLAAYADDTFFKLYLCDVGLLRALADIPYASFLQTDGLFKEFRGAITENYVLSELVKQDLTPYFWRSNQSAEVDFVCRLGQNIVPIEVKSELNTRSRSLSVYISKYQVPQAIRLSMKNMGSTPPIFSIPLQLSYKLREWFEH